MKAITLTTIILLSVSFAINAQSKGPGYKNAKSEVKYDGERSIWVDENPGELKGPANKNYKQKNNVYKTDKGGPIVASADSKLATNEEAKNEKVFVAVELKESKGKNSLGLKGPAYKNHHPGN